jgi:hypothetical protein
MKKIDQTQSHFDKFILVGPQNAISQSFKINGDNLSGVRIHLKNHRLGGNRKYNLAIRDINGTVLRETEFSESNVGDEQIFRYDFPVITKDTRNEYLLTLSYSPGNDAVEKVNIDILTLYNKNILSLESNRQISIEEASMIEKEFLSLAYTSLDKYGQGAAYYEGIGLEGDIEFQLYSQTTPLVLINSIPRRAISRIYQDIPFLLFYSLIWIFLIFVIIKRLKMGIKK